MDGQVIYSKKIKVSWSNDDKYIEITKVFLTNLDPRVNDVILIEAFKPFQLLEVHVTKSGDSNKPVNGTIIFPTRENAENAIREMNEKVILSYSIKCSWDSEEVNESSSSINFRKSPPCSDDVLLANMSYEEIFAGTPLYNTSISITNLPKQIIKQDIASYLQQYGYVSDIYIDAGKGSAVAKLDTHANAANATFALQGISISGKIIQFDWAKSHSPKYVDSQDDLKRSYNVFSLGHTSPKKMVEQITALYNNHTITRPPTPAFIQEDEGINGCNQYYQYYYSAGDLTI